MAETSAQGENPCNRSGEHGPWNPGIQSQLPAQLRHLCTIFRPENAFSSVAAATELQQLTGFPLCELAVFRPQRLLLHEVLIRVTADFSVPDGSRIEDLGINFRQMTGLLLRRYLEPQMTAIVATYEQARRQLSDAIRSGLSAVAEGPKIPGKAGSPVFKLFAHIMGRRRAAATASCVAMSVRGGSGEEWGPAEIAACERMAGAANDVLHRTAYRALARVMSSLFTTHGRAWGTKDLIVSLATDLACNIHGSDAIGQMIEPMLRRAAAIEGYALLPRQEQPVVINTKGPSASGKSTLRPLQKQLAGNLGVQWRDFALISPDIWRKQLLDYGSLRSAFKYAGAFTSEELQIIDQKLDRYMAVKHERGDMAHLLIDRFRFDSFAPDSEEAGSNLLTRFGHSVYLFFVITPPEQLVERAWNRGLEVGRYKAVDDTLAHSVEAYAGMPHVFFTWVRRADKQIHIEFLDNSVRLGELPRTAAFGTNHTLNLLDLRKILDIERYGRIDVDAQSAAALYPDPGRLAPGNNIGFLKQCLQVFREVNFADQATGRLYLRVRSGAPVLIDPEALQAALGDPDVRAALRIIVPTMDSAIPVVERPEFLRRYAERRPVTLGQWGTGEPGPGG